MGRSDRPGSEGTSRADDTSKARPAPRLPSGVCLLAGVVAWGSLGCSGLARGDDTLDPRWGCLGEPSVQAQSLLVQAQSSAVVKLRFRDLFQQSSLGGVGVDACLSSDSACASPIAAGLVASEDGTLDIPLYRGFEGYLELEAEGIISTLYFLPPLAGNLDLGEVGLIREVNLRTFNENFNAGIDFDKGHLVLTTRDCNGNPVEGMHLSTNAGGKPFVMDGGLPSFVDPITGPPGAGGFLNLEVGGAYVTGEVVGAEQQRWLVADGNYSIRGAWATMARIGPYNQ